MESGIASIAAVLHVLQQMQLRLSSQQQRYGQCAGWDAWLGCCLWMVFCLQRSCRALGPAPDLEEFQPTYVVRAVFGVRRRLCQLCLCGMCGRQFFVCTCFSEGVWLLSGFSNAWLQLSCVSWVCLALGLQCLGYLGSSTLLCASWVRCLALLLHQAGKVLVHCLSQIPASPCGEGLSRRLLCELPVCVPCVCVCVCGLVSVVRTQDCAMQD